MNESANTKHKRPLKIPSTLEAAIHTSVQAAVSSSMQDVEEKIIDRVLTRLRPADENRQHDSEIVCHKMFNPLAGP